MKRTPRVVPPPSKAVQDQLRGVHQIHVLPQWLRYGSPGSPGSPYPPLRIDGWHVLKVKPSMSPELLALQDKDKPSCQQGGWNGEDWKDWNDSSDWSQQWNSWNSMEEWVQNERYQEKDMVEDSHAADANQKASFDDDYEDYEYEYIIKEPETQPVFHRKPSMVAVGELRFSQKSCGKTFQCGRPVSQLVQKLIDGEVELSAPFLQLTVYEDTDSDGYPIIKCIDNRRLFALKEYAMRSGKEVMVNVEYFSQNTVKKVRRIIQNSDNTDGREVRMRRGRRTINNNKKCCRGRF